MNLKSYQYKQGKSERIKLPTPFPPPVSTGSGSKGSFLYGNM